MVDERELRQRLAALISGNLSLDRFSDWLVDYSLDMHRDSSHAAQQLVWDIQLPIDEFESGYASRDELDKRLRSVLSTVRLVLQLDLNSGTVRQRGPLSGSLTRSVVLDVPPAHPLEVVRALAASVLPLFQQSVGVAVPA